MSSQDSLLSRKLASFREQLRSKKISDENFLDNLNVLLDSFPKSEYKDGAHAHFSGNYYEVEGKVGKALNLYTKAQHHFENCCTSNFDYIENINRIGITTIHSGFLNFDTLFFRKGYKDVEKAYDLSKIHGFTELEYRLLDFKGDYHFHSGYEVQDYDKALEYYLEFEKLLQDSPDSTYLYIESKSNLATLYRKIGSTKLSDQYFEEALFLSEKYKQYRNSYGLYVDKSKFLEDQKQYKQALVLCEKAYNEAVKLDNKEIMNRSNRRMYRSYRLVNDYESALKYLELHFHGLIEMNKAEALQLQAKLESRQALDQQELEIASLKNKNLSSSRNFLTVLILLILAILCFAFWAYSRLKKTNKKLVQKNEEILLAQMKGQNIERKRMRAELQDNLNSKIAEVKSRLEAHSILLDVKNSNVLKGTSNLINDIDEDIRLISQNLFPEAVDRIGLIPSLETLLDSLNENDSTEFHLISKLKHEKNLNNFSYELYNIIFEMINNILKHSAAKNAWISISEYEMKINVTVKDDGKGFEIKENMGGFGLKSITSRIQKLDGRYKIESSIDTGTNYALEIPIQRYSN